MTEQPPHPSERGVSMIEIIVVLVIVAVLLAIGLNGMRGTRKDGMRRVAREVAKSYAEAAGDYAVDNGGKVPVPGSADWPTVQVERGPIDRLNKIADQRYLRGAPESVTDGRVRLETQAGTGGSPTTIAVVRYRVINASVMQIVASYDGEDLCQISNGPTGSTLPEC